MGNWRFIQNLYYYPEENRSDLLSDNGYVWSAFAIDDDKRCKVTTNSSNLILSFWSIDVWKEWTYIQPLSLDPDKEHMIIVQTDDEILDFHVDGHSVTRLFLSEIFNSTG